LVAGGGVVVVRIASSVGVTIWAWSPRAPPPTDQAERDITVNAAIERYLTEHLQPAITLAGMVAFGIA
jgi:hypothetical protein